MLIVAAGVAVVAALGHAPSAGDGTPTSVATTTTGPGTPPPVTPTSSATPPPPSASTTPAAPPATPTTQPTTTAPATHPSLAPTTVSISTAQWSDGAARVSGFATVVEEGGTCTLTLTKGSVTVTGSRPATVDATTTSCGVVQVSDPRLTPGTWQAVLSYTSRTSTGTSAPTTITIG